MISNNISVRVVIKQELHLYYSCTGKLIIDGIEWDKCTSDSPETVSRTLHRRFRNIVRLKVNHAP